MRKIKNWKFYVFFVVGLILDVGFNEVQPALEMIGISEKYIGYIRIIIIVLGTLRLKLSLPTQDKEKLTEIVSNLKKD